MSLEAAIADLAEAVRENSDLIKGMTAKAGSAAGKTEDGDKKPSTRRTAKPKAITAKEIAAATTAYLEVDDQDEYDERKGIIKKIVNKFDAAKMSEIDDENRAEAMALLQIAIDGGNPFKKSRRDEDDVA